MQNVYVCKGTDVPLGQESNSLQLLAKRNNLEIMIQEVKENSFAWITPSENEDAIEFFYILSGDVILEDKTDKMKLVEGDSFYCSELKDEIILKSEHGFKMLYVSSVQTFDYLDQFSSYLDDVLSQIEKKDNYTYGHCKRVMDYCIKIATAMKLSGVSINNITVASAFHDVGKCFIPDEILNKKEKLDDDEFLYIMKHPIYSIKILKKKFGRDITSIVEAHHERLDGSGYPYGKRGSEIPLEAQIIAIADSFDAMTSNRVYNSPKSFDEAVKELYSMDDKYNRKIVKVLMKLIESNSL